MLMSMQSRRRGHDKEMKQVQNRAEQSRTEHVRSAGRLSGEHVGKLRFLRFSQFQPSSEPTPSPYNVPPPSRLYVYIIYRLYNLHWIFSFPLFRNQLVQTIYNLYLLSNL